MSAEMISFLSYPSSTNLEILEKRIDKSCRNEHFSHNEALDILKFTPKKAAKIIFKVVTSAAANAVHNDGKKQESLRIGQVIVNAGSFNKRFLASTRGRALRIHKPTAHITVELSDK